MRKIWLPLAGAAIMTASCALPALPAFANSQNQIGHHHRPHHHGQDAGLKPGGDPSDPQSYPFLQPGQQQPLQHTRTHHPQPVGTNLALNQPYTVTAQWPDPLFASVQQRLFPNNGQLTNGQIGTTNFLDPQWVGFYRQYGHSVVVNLGKPENIRGVSLDFLQNSGAGITFPGHVTYYVSQNGVTWQKEGTVASTAGTWSTAIQTQPFEETSLNVNAQYVMARFNVAIWAFADQFSVYGYPTANPKAYTPQGSPLPQSPPRGYLTSTSAGSGGVNNVLLAYADGYGASGTWTQADWAPMLTNLSSSGQPKGNMFDSVLFQPYGTLPTTAAGWSGYVSNLFTPGIQLSSLNQAVAAAHPPGSNPGFQEKVVISIPGTDSNPSAFGAVSPSGQNLNMDPAAVGSEAAYQAKKTAIHWYIRQVLAAWKQAHFQNLQLAGFYWEPESVDFAVQFDKRLILNTSKQIHSHGLRFYWIPFYGAYGVPQWKQLGFDAVMIQPNVSFNWSMAPEPRFASVAQMAQYYGTGVEIEAHWDVTSVYTNLAQIAQNKYFDYFTAGHVFGFAGNVVKGYYENSMTLVTAYQSTNPFYHQVYSNTGLFINNEWNHSTFH